MRIQALKRAVIANGFVRARDLAIPTDAKRRAAGELIFNSPLMSINGSISCRDCHLDQFGSTDGLPNAVGVGGNGVGAERLQSGGRIIPRNVLPFWGRGGKGFDTFFWDGKVSVANGKVVSQFGDRPPSEDPLVVAIHLPSVELREMVSDTPEVRDTLVTETVSTAEQVQGRLARRFAKDPKIGRFLAAAYGKKPADISFGDVGDALASFIRHEFRIQPTPLHRFVYGRRPITDAELAGGILFYGRGKCAGCHGGPYFSDLAFHAVAFPQVGFGKNGFGNDEGRYNVTLDPVDRFLFRTPPLYNVTRTAPYSHSGSVARLEDAIAAHFDPLRLIQFDKMSVQERSAMYARLGPASRETLPSALTDDEVRQLAAFLAMLEF
ncbi:His-Xaa-Ser system-associated MauG-like protein [Novosphingopyxis sp.]|uniref:His-Xaa-Ser system-associated MauG-like protein n=1 Tax=Novosphingopyxis sp. TaxID=2709690 RepID=UPI003B5B4026